MTADITNYFLTTLLSSLIAGTESSIAQWAPNTRYLDGARVRAGDRLYMASNIGITGTVAPTHSSGRANDGTVTWVFVMSIPPAQALGSSYYLGVGHPDQWAAEPTADQIGPDSQAMALEDLTTLIRLVRRDLALGAARLPWATATVIPQWPASNSYVNVGASVYRCISNNSGANSTVSPSGTALSTFETADGYVWKYLGDVSGTLDAQFGFPDIFAINPLYTNDGSDRWNVQTVAKSGEISGYSVAQQVGAITTPLLSYVRKDAVGTGAAARVDVTGLGVIERIVPTAFGQDYKLGTVALVRQSGSVGSGAVVANTLDAGGLDTLTVSAQGTGYTGGAVALVDGDGTGAQVTLTVTSGFVTGATIAAAGTGYTWATVHVIPGVAGALAHTVASPQGGHGKDMTKEIPINHLLVNRRLTALDSGYLPTGEFRQLSLLTGVVAASGGGDILVGPAHPGPGARNAADLAGARVLYLSNIAAVEHTDAQDEEIKIALKIE